MTVVSLTVEAFKRLEAAHVKPTPTGLVLVRGENEQGKSSLIESMLAALLGKEAAPELPIHEGAHGAAVVLDLGELVVKRRWTRDSGGKAKTSLTVEGREGGELRSPQAVLDALTGRFADPVAFLTMKPADQVKTVLAILGLDEKLRELEARHDDVYTRRRDLGRDVDRTAKAEAQIALEVEGLPTAAVDVGAAQALALELTGAKDNNARRAAAERAKANAGELGKAVVARIEKLDAEIAALREQANGYRQAWTQADEILKSTPEVDIEPILARTRALEEAQRNAGRRELLERIRAEAAIARAAHAESEAALGALRTAIDELLAGATFPVDGMTYDPETKGLRIGTIPFSQASQAERLRAAAAIAMAGSPTIRVMFARDGSALDDRSRAILAELAEKNGFQLWLEVVDSTREGSGVWIEDGHAYQAAEATPQS